MTVKRVIPRRLAHHDIDAALAHYAQEAGPAVAEGLIDALEKAFQHLGRHPATGSPRLGHDLNLPGLRSWPLTRYPYLVFYVEHPEHIDVWRVLHAQRDLPAWLQSPDES
jgi:toxin ParE1/3/4